MSFDNTMRIRAHLNQDLLDAITILEQTTHQHSDKERMLLGMLRKQEEKIKLHLNNSRVSMYSLYLTYDEDSMIRSLIQQSRA